jgi:hypothetical protein
MVAFAACLRALSAWHSHTHSHTHVLPLRLARAAREYNISQTLEFFMRIHITGWLMLGMAACASDSKELVDEGSAELGANSTWQVCAKEGETCAFTGTLRVRYGVNGRFTRPKRFTNGTPCTREVFGDPAIGVGKQCEMEVPNTPVPPVVVPPTPVPPTDVGIGKTVLIYPISSDTSADIVATKASTINALPGNAITVAVNATTYNFYQVRHPADDWRKGLAALRAAGVTKRIYVKTEMSNFVNAPPLFTNDAHWNNIIIPNIVDLLTVLAEAKYDWVNDNEPYPWAPEYRKEFYRDPAEGDLYPGRAPAEVRNLAYAWGEKIGAAIASKHPSCTVVTLHGPYEAIPGADSFKIARGGQGGQLFPTSYSLAGELFAGMYESSASANHVDGGELYNLRSAGEFQLSSDTRAALYADPSKLPFAKKPAQWRTLERGFGIWSQASQGYTMSPSEFTTATKNAIAAATPKAVVWLYIDDQQKAVYDLGHPFTKSLHDAGL